MIKSCVLLDGVVINIGEWDYQYQSIEVTPAELDEEGSVVTEAVYEDVAQNTLPEGAIIIEREVTQNADGGLVLTSDYEALRKAEYPSLADQLDAMWKGEPYHSDMQDIVLAIKAKYPKPE